VIIKRWIGIIFVAIAIGTGLSVGLSAWKDWSFRATEVALLREAEAHSLSPDNPPSPNSFFPIDVVSRPPIVSGIQVLSVDETLEKIDGDELVIGVVVNGAARAYSLNSLTGPDREIFNDTLGERAIAATW
jgi:Protein of unknown function (DUF3179)